MRSDRRKFTTYLAAGAVLGLGGGAAWLAAPRDHSHLAVDKVLDRLDALSPDSIRSTGAWDAARTFGHLAQSVEFSMAGFPEERSALFQNTVGSLAYKVFRARGAMHHGLDEPIPGEVVATETAAATLTRLKTALTTFRSYESDLKPHFAYGRLSKDDYALAHALHVEDHLEEILLA